MPIIVQGFDRKPSSLRQQSIHGRFKWKIKTRYNNKMLTLQHARRALLLGVHYINVPENESHCCRRYRCGLQETQLKKYMFETRVQHNQFKRINVIRL